MMAYVKDHIKYTHTYQFLKYNRFFYREAERLAKLPEDEGIFHRHICYYNKKKAIQISQMLSRIQITLRPEERFQTWIDVGVYLSNVNRIIDNMPPDYRLIINNSLSDILKQYSQMTSESSKNICILLKAVIGYVDRICRQIELHLAGEENSNLQRSLCYFQRMKDFSAESLEEAFQRILFWSSLFWQTRHRLVGLGRLDLVLKDIPFSNNDEDTISVIVDFYKAIHKYYAYKSNAVAMGDTGQIIICGGLDSKGNYFCNKLSYLFIRAMMKSALPDPKILLRISNNMPEELLRLALECISTGLGCPLLSNDEVVIPALKAVGYSHEDACNYVTSACWEPLAYGKSFGQNNLETLNFAEALVEMYNDNALYSCETFEDILDCYKSVLLKKLKQCIATINNIKWEEDPLLSLFMQNCSSKDISQGGAVYNDYGILSVGLANTVDSLCNIRRYVFKEKKYILLELVDNAQSDFRKDPEMRK